ncbi:MAG: hypothetical protein NUV83_03380 [Candidatus Wolfebacteria bacterium]|nr:hypothetical protein [Candidatus Wolfebacteria bacterium]
MLEGIYTKISRKEKLFLLVLFIALAIYFVGRFVMAKPQIIPADFLKARQQASLIAQDIVGTANESSRNLEKISELDGERKYADAIKLVAQELEHNNQARQRAVYLSSQLETMAKNVPSISPDSSAQKALEAVSLETTLINRLITHNDYLNQLLGILRDKFLGQNKNSHDKIAELVSKINEEAKAINEINQKFNDKLSDFDGK